MRVQSLKIYDLETSGTTDAKLTFQEMHRVRGYRQVELRVRQLAPTPYRMHTEVVTHLFIHPEVLVTTEQLPQARLLAVAVLIRRFEGLDSA